jgi:hypothetical protein
VGVGATRRRARHAAWAVPRQCPKMQNGDTPGEGYRRTDFVRPGPVQAGPGSHASQGALVPSRP